MLKSLLLVGTGGFFGSVARYAVAYAVGKMVSTTFPLGTFLINIAGCFIIGLLYGLFQKEGNAQSGAWLILATGFCGGFTTFSAFALENVALLKQQLNTTAMLYTAASVVIGLLLCKLGITLAT